jgi:hypothetical protein
MESVCSSETSVNFYLNYTASHSRMHQHMYLKPNEAFFNFRCSVLSCIGKIYILKVSILNIKFWEKVFCLESEKPYAFMHTHTHTHSDKPLDLYSRIALFKSRMGHRLVFLLFLSPSRQILRYFPKLGHGRFLRILYNSLFTNLPNLRHYIR